jgi:ubiquinone/menaquinone biosynthesis C-methylase UbiE
VAFAFAPYVREVVGVDVSPEMLEAAERARLTRRVENVYFRWADANRLPFEPGSFDIIICHDLLPYIFNPRTLLADCRRILAPAGRLILDEMTGNDNPVKRATHDAIEARRDPAFLKSRSMSDIGQMVDEAGFHIAKAESYEVQRESGEWLDRAAADDGTRAAVRAMLETSIEGNAAGLDVRRGRNGTLTFTQRRMRLLGVVRET